MSLHDWLLLYLAVGFVVCLLCVRKERNEREKTPSNYDASYHWAVFVVTPLFWPLVALVEFAGGFGKWLVKERQFGKALDDV